MGGQGQVAGTALSTERRDEAEARGERVPLCSVCRRRERRFVLAGQGRCLPCALRFQPMLRRSFYTAIVVGSVLTAINQGNLIFDGRFPADLAWKVPLTYVVPFCVATWGALINSRR